MKKEQKIDTFQENTFVLKEHSDSSVVQTFVHRSKIPKSKADQISALRAEISAYLFDYLSKYQIPTHYIKKLSKNQLNVLKTQAIPVIVRIYNFINSIFKINFMVQEGAPLMFPVIENYYLNPEFHKIIINETHIAGLNIIPLEDFRSINKLALKVNALLRPLFERRNLILSEIELECGRFKNKILVCGELSPVTFKVWNKSAKNKIDFDYFNFQGDNVYEQYNEFKKRLIPGS
ncbi:MAG: Phosphoribosylaminoimidazole-succinocarboxamide synthase [Ignavibacteriae bacterium]|nr:MAG: Phosphoribosylaminoimidazole-succinocarboxamide synthase [Ignavibacteriota bacterium]